MEKKLAVLTAVFALSAGLVFAQEMKSDEPVADDAAMTAPADAMMENEDAMSNEMMANEEMMNETNGAEEEMPADEAPATEGAESK